MLRLTANTRLFIVALLAMTLVVRGIGCEAAAAAPGASTAVEAHCPNMPSDAGKPMKAAVDACALCTALPDAPLAQLAATPLLIVEPVAAAPAQLMGLSGGPAPPPPRIG